MKNQKGFIQIPLLIAIIVGVLIIGGVGYVGIKQYKNYQAEKIEKEKITQETQQQKDLEVDKLKKEVEDLKNQPPKAVTQEKIIEKVTDQTSIITQKDIESYLDGVVAVECDFARGSGSLWKFNDGYFVLTNKHVISKGTSHAPEQSSESCSIGFLQGDYFIELLEQRPLQNSGLDIVFVEFKPNEAFRIKSINAFKALGKELPTNIPIDKLNYSISQLRLCPKEMKISAPVSIVGFPASTNDKTFLRRTITDGIISAIDQSTIIDGLQNPNYFVSAKIDSGNSGGVAFSKDESGICFLGIPTWLSIGNYDNQGVIQNANNLFK